jgi:hypothetical protein
MNNDIDVGRIKEDLKKVSKQVFNKLYRLEIAAVASAIQPPIWSRQLSVVLGIAENQVASEVGNFAAMGALQRFPARHDRRKIHVVVPHPLWGFARELVEVTIQATYLDDGEMAVAAYWSAVLDGAQPQKVPR